MKTVSIFVSLALGALLNPQASAALIWWSPLDGNADALIGANGVAGGSPTPASDLNGNASGAVQFNGTTDFFTIVPSQAIFTEGSLSIWVLPTNFTNAEAGPFSVGESGAGTDQYFALHRTWRGDLDDGVARLDVVSNVTAPTGVWQHVVLTFTAQGELRMYIDGTLQTDVQSLAGAAASYTFSHDWIVGAERSLEVNRFFAGTLDDARIYDNELTAGEVTTLFTAGPFLVPEPAAAVLTGVMGLALLARRRRRPAV
jgi:hypothetical protein